MSRKKPEISVQDEMRIDEMALYERVSAIIENRRARAGAYANREVTMMY